MKNQVYIVTGGSKGFGLAIAKALVQRGAKVGLLGRDPASLEQAVAELGVENAFGTTADVASKSDVLAAFDLVTNHFGQVDGLVNNAGMAKPNPVEKLLEDDVLMQVSTNFVGTVLCCQAVIPLLRGRANPRIINISSASAHHSDEMSHLSIYAATKAAVERFTRDLRTELRADAIGVTCIRPGNAGTNFSDAWDQGAKEAGIAAWQDSGRYVDIGMEAAQVGEAVAFALAQPVGVAIDLMEIRPNVPLDKSLLT
jgi:NAD(P)-dependent dehydrogenase (short-subunit alcohol dehydrogenase family)